MQHGMFGWVRKTLKSKSQRLVKKDIARMTAELSPDCALNDSHLSARHFLSVRTVLRLHGRCPCMNKEIRLKLGGRFTKCGNNSQFKNKRAHRKIRQMGQNVKNWEIQMIGM